MTTKKNSQNVGTKEEKKLNELLYFSPPP